MFVNKIVQRMKIINVYAILDTMKIYKHASNVTIHGNYIIFLNNFCESETCDGPNLNNCKTCKNEDQRVLTNLNECPCKIGFYDILNIYACKACHYSWFLNYLFYYLKV